MAGRKPSAQAVAKDALGGKGSAFQFGQWQKNPMQDGSGDSPPVYMPNLAFKDVGTYGLRQFQGWLREEFLKALQGREAARTYREMGDNCATVGAMLFAVVQLMRKVEWRIIPANDSPEAQKEADFVASLQDDMSDTWQEFITSALSMIQYGYSLHEIVYKKRNGRKSKTGDGDADSKFDDGRIGVKRLAIRGHDTILKWFFDENGQTTGVRQQPWVGPLIDLPIEKLLLFRPTAYKANPEGRSILRSSYRSYYLLKRLEEMEAILFERLGGFPVMQVPAELITAADGGNAAAIAAMENYKKIITNVRIDEQMGLIIPSNHYASPDGTISAAPMFKFELVVPQSSGRATSSLDTVIERYKLDILMTMLADFLTQGKSTRGAQTTAISKVDLFYQAIEGWLRSIAEVLNRHLLPRIWALNNLDPDLMPEFEPDMAQRIDLDSLGNFVLHLAQAGMTMFPDKDLENYIRDAAGIPNITDDEWDAREVQRQQQAQNAAMGVQVGATGDANAPGPDDAMTGKRPAAVTQVPAGPRSAGPQRGLASGVHAPNTNAAEGTQARPLSQPRPSAANIVTKAEMKAAKTRRHTKLSSKNRVIAA